MKILLIGCNGQLGWELQRTLPYFGELLSVDFPEIDLSNADSVQSVVTSFKPHVVINAAAYTDVDRAESQPELCMKVNCDGPKFLAEACDQNQSVLVHYSTDYVFSGETDRPYREDDKPGPVSVYAESKLRGEQAIQATFDRFLILRTAWMYSLRASSFLTKVLSWSEKSAEISVVDDQISNPTWARAMAEITTLMLARLDSQAWPASLMGVYHLAGDGYTSRYEWAKAIIEIANQHQVKVNPAKSEDFHTPARRPRFSALDCSKFYQAFDLRLPHWQACLRLSMKK